MSDDGLAARAKNGDMKAFDMLHKRYRSRILNYIYRYIGDYQRAEEITQETFLRVYKHLATYQPLEKFSSWLYRIATNLSKNALRDRRHDPKISLNVPVSEGVPELIESIPGDLPQPDKKAEQKEFEKEVQKAIDSLPGKYKTVLLLCGTQNMSYQEAAETLKCSMQTVGVRLNRARKMMRKILSPPRKQGSKFLKEMI